MAGDTIIILDPDTGQVDFEWVRYVEDGQTLVLSSVDYDLSDEHGWASYRITNFIYRENSLAPIELPSSIDITMDDGRRILQEFDYLGYREMRPGSEQETIYDAQGRVESIERVNSLTIPEISFENFFAFRQQTVRYDVETGNIDSVTILHHDGRVEFIDYDPASGQREYLHHLQRLVPPGGAQGGAGEAGTGIVTLRRVTAADGSSREDLQDAQGRLDYVVERAASGGIRATDFDLSGEHSWASYVIDYLDSGTGDSLLPSRVEAWMADGSHVQLQIQYSDDNAGVRGSETYTHRDAQGRILAVDQTNLAQDTAQAVAFRQQSTVFDPASGRVDFISTLSLAGDRESIDYDVTTGQRDYVHIQRADGGTISEDYNAANGVLDYRRITGADGSSLDEDYDSQGRLDYAVERLADGRVRVTDYDLADQHGWASTSILYAASGAIESITLL